MISKKMESAINNQINAEFYSSYLYLSMSSYLQSINLKGFANWMRIQAQEELYHAMKFYDYVNERGGKVLVKQIEKPPTEWDSPLAVFEYTYKHEQKVTSLINNLVDLAISEKDHASNSFLQWYINEQVEEESNADELVRKLKMMADTVNGLFIIDQELTKRIPLFTFPQQAAGNAQ